jgi:hypothetical protein
MANDGARGLSAWLSYPRSLVIAVVIAAAFYARILTSGFLIDDYTGLTTLDGHAPTMGTWWDLYRVSNGVEADVARQIAAGKLPWWSAPDFRFSLLRPLSSVLLAAVFPLFGFEPFGYHALSLLMFCGFVALAGRFFHKVLPPTEATWSTVLVALHSYNVDSVSYVAACHAIVAGIFSMLAMSAHVDWVTGGKRRSLAGALGFWVLALAASEVAVAVLPLALGYALFRDSGPPWARLKKVAPMAGVMGIYLAVYAITQRGMSTSEIYVSPFGDPVEFGRRVIGDYPKVFVGVLTHTMFLRDALTLPWWVDAAAALVVAALVVVLLRSLRGDEAKSMRMFALAGAALLVVACTKRGPGTHLFLVSVTAMPLVAAALVASYRALRASRSLRKVLAGTVTVVVALVHLPVSALEGWVFMSFMATWSKVSARTVRRLALPPSAKEVVLVRVNAPGVGLWGSSMHHVLVGETSHPWWLLSGDVDPVHVERPSANVIEVVPTKTPTLVSDLERAFRDNGRTPVPQGYRVVTRLYTVTVVEAAGGGATRLRAEFDRPIDDPSLCFLSLNESGLHQFEPPAVGGSVFLGGAPRSISSFNDE